MSLHPVLERILAHKREEVRHSKQLASIAELERIAAKHGPRRSLRESILKQTTPFRVVAEVKRSSPSTMLRPTGFDPVNIAKGYEKAGAAAISTLTDSRFFCGSPMYLPMIREAVSIPVLRKDFILDMWQVAESAALGADAMLLMVVNFPDIAVFEKLYIYTMALGMEPLVEIHSIEEWDTVKHLEPKLVGVNNRDFKSATLAFDTAATTTIAPALPDDVVVISESGLSSRDELERLKQAGVDGFLIGSALMKEADPGEALKKLIG